MNASAVGSLRGTSRAGLEDVLGPGGGGHHSRKPDGAHEDDEGVPDLLGTRAGLQRAACVAVHGPLGSDRRSSRELDQLNVAFAERPGAPA
jgi:hypothetical protein